MEFHDIYDYLYIPFWKTKPFVYGIAFLTASILIFAMYKWLQYQKNKKPKQAPTPWEHALNQLKKLKHQKCSSQQEFKQFYFELTNITKQYLKKRFGWNILQKTDLELIAFLTEKNRFSNSIDRITQALQGSQLIKFAQVQALQEQAQQDLETIITLVNETTPTEPSK